MLVYQRVIQNGPKNGGVMFAPKMMKITGIYGVL
jgi:hypothetical protein